MRPQPQLISIGAKISPFRLLIDLRPESYGIQFGIVMKVARQYGVKYSPEGDYIRFSAPKSRLQMFAEKLHFSGINFFDL